MKSRERFDFRIFSNVVAKAYRQTEKTGIPLFTLSESLEIFRYYFSKYEAMREEYHPALNVAQVSNILKLMPHIEADDGTIDLSADEYPPLIDKHFQTAYRNCDYRINHFFSGKIRLLRYYEVLREEPDEADEEIEEPDTEAQDSLRHCFHVTAARECGVLPALMLEYFRACLGGDSRILTANGKRWFSISIEGLHKVFDYLTNSQIRNAVEKLVSGGYIEKGVVNEASYDRTSCYSLTDKGASLF